MCQHTEPATVHAQQLHRPGSICLQPTTSWRAAQSYKLAAAQSGRTIQASPVSSMDQPPARNLPPEALDLRPDLGQVGVFRSSQACSKAPGTVSSACQYCCTQPH